MVAASAASPAQAPANAQQQNMLARQLVLAQAIDMWLPIAQGTISSAIAGQVVNIPARNVGLIKRFVIELTFTVARAAAETQTRTEMGPANALSQIIFTDLSNQNRIQTAGWHMHALATARRQLVNGAAYTTDTPTGFASNFSVISAPSSFTAGNQTIRMFYEIPIAYGDYDLRGAVYANVVNATMNLQFTINPTFFVGSAADPTLAVYQSSTAGDIGTLSSVSYTIYQNFLDQLPVGKQGPVLPLLDLSQAYLLNNTQISGLVANQDNPIPYANFRNFLSTFALYDNNGYTTSVGGDVSYWALQSANYTNIFKLDPIIASYMARQIIGDDCPSVAGKSMYYFDFRKKPIATVQYGNMQLVLNPTNVQGSTTAVLIGYEALAQINQIVQAGSLYGN